jgi:hypothetical protein
MFSITVKKNTKNSPLNVSDIVQPEDNHYTSKHIVYFQINIRHHRSYVWGLKKAKT